MNNELNIDIQASNTYLAISVAVCLLSLFSTWYYFYSLWLSLIISIGLLRWWLYFLPRFLWLSHPHSIVKILLFEKYIIIEKNDNSTQQYTEFHAEYQSRFLVIIRAGKNTVVIFKDTVVSNSLSAINRYFNAHA
ncbi:hypothetical protein MNB_SUP05-SYMBIONT-7-196 [hydrothermal vent metagenome]|uniref:Uncharacterized protein n=1 Tax=hydrothermal vent metagenome TaxID=652676 RepID=A0A1W1E5T4_9ZZZZ